MPCFFLSVLFCFKAKKIKEPNAFHILNGTLGSFTFYFLLYPIFF